MTRKDKGVTSLMSRFAIVLWDKKLSEDPNIANEFKKVVADRLSNHEAGATLFVAYSPGLARLELARVVFRNAAAGYKKAMDVLKKLRKGSDKGPWSNIKKSSRKTDILVYIVSDPVVFSQVTEWFLKVYLKDISESPELPAHGPYMVVVDPWIEGDNRIITGMKRIELITF